jgi:hypothetical protein
MPSINGWPGIVLVMDSDALDDRVTGLPGVVILVDSNALD